MFNAYKKIALVNVLAVTLCVPGFSTNNAQLDDLTVVRTNHPTNGSVRHNVFMRSEVGNPRDGTSAVYAELQNPNMPYFAPYHPTGGARINNGVISFPLVMRLPGQHFGGNLIPALQAQLNQEGITANNFYVGIVAQNMPFSAQTQLCLRPHTYIYPNAPAQQAGYDQQQNIQVALFGMNGDDGHFLGQLNNEQLLQENVHLHQQDNITVLSPNNMQIIGPNFQNPQRFFSYVSFNENGHRAAIICYHLLMTDLQCQSLQAALMGRTLQNLGQRANLAELLRVTPRNPNFNGFNGLQRALGLFREPRAFEPVQVVAPAVPLQFGFGARLNPAAVPAFRNARPLTGYVPTSTQTNTVESLLNTIISNTPAEQRPIVVEALGNMGHLPLETLVFLQEMLQFSPNDDLRLDIMFGVLQNVFAQPWQESAEPARIEVLPARVQPAPARSRNRHPAAVRARPTPARQLPVTNARLFTPDERASFIANSRNDENLEIGMRRGPNGLYVDAIVESLRILNTRRVLNETQIAGAYNQVVAVIGQFQRNAARNAFFQRRDVHTHPIAQLYLRDERANALLALDGRTDYCFFHNPFRGNAESELCLALVWNEINAYVHTADNTRTEIEREQMRESLVVALGQCIMNDGHRVCNWGKAQRIFRVLQGRVPGIVIDDVVPTVEEFRLNFNNELERRLEATTNVPTDVAARNGRLLDLLVTAERPRGMTLNELEQHITRIRNDFAQAVNSQYPANDPRIIQLIRGMDERFALWRSYPQEK